MKEKKEESNKLAEETKESESDKTLGNKKPMNESQAKLYQVIKALSAMRHGKQDSTPSAILVRNPPTSESEKQFTSSYLLFDKT